MAMIRPNFIKVGENLSEVPAGDGVLPHQRIHGWGEEQWLGKIPSPDDAGNEIISQTIGPFGQRVGIQRGNQHGIGPSPKLNVKNVVTPIPARFWPLVGISIKTDTIAGPDLLPLRQEIIGGMCEGDTDFISFAAKAFKQLGRFDRGDRASHTNQKASHPGPFRFWIEGRSVVLGDEIAADIVEHVGQSIPELAAKFIGLVSAQQILLLGMV
jgi:hypothetical protein